MTENPNAWLELLFSRLSWPSPMVRERATFAIACLMSKEQDGFVKAQLLQWLRAQDLESLAVVGVLACLRAKRLDAANAPSAAEIVSALTAPSLVTRLLLKAEYDIDGLRAPIPRSVEPETAPTESFLRGREGYLTPVFAEMADKCDRHWKGLGFTRCWFAQWHHLRTQRSVKFTDPIPFFRGRFDRDHLPNVDFPMTELYKSAFLRALDEGLALAKIPLTLAESFAARLCPVDLALWEIQTAVVPPHNWPTIASSTVGSIDTSFGNAVSGIRSLAELNLLHDGSDMALYQSGPIPGSNGHLWGEMEAVLQRTCATGTPRGEAIYHFLSERALRRLGSRTSLRADGWLIPSEQDFEVTRFGGWELMPLVTPVFPAVVPQWQIWRGFGPLHLPSPMLYQDKRYVQAMTDGMHVLDGDSIVGRWRDWVEVIEERLIANLPPRGGQIVTVPRKLVEENCSFWGANLAYVWHVKSYHRQDDWGEFKVHSEYGLVGGSRIIVP